MTWQDVAWLTAFSLYDDDFDDRDDEYDDDDRDDEDDDDDDEYGVWHALIRGAIFYAVLQGLQPISE